MNCPFKTYLRAKHWSWRRAGGPCDRKHEQKNAWHSRSISCFWRFQAPRRRHSSAQTKLVGNVKTCQRVFNNPLRLTAAKILAEVSTPWRNRPLTPYVWRGTGSLKGPHLLFCTNQLGRALITVGWEIAWSRLGSHCNAELWASLHSRGWEPQH